VGDKKSHVLGHGLQQCVSAEKGIKQPTKKKEKADGEERKRTFEKQVRDESYIVVTAPFFNEISSSGDRFLCHQFKSSRARFHDKDVALTVRINRNSQHNSRTKKNNAYNNIYNHIMLSVVTITKLSLFLKKKRGKGRLLNI